MEWYYNAVFYELYVRAFYDSNGDGHGDFAGLRQKLDYLQWLGVDCIWLLPINQSPLKDDGYDVSSYYSIHPSYGFLEDFMLTVEEVHQRGMKIIIDMVLNHTSDQHPWFKESRSGKDSPLRDFYVWSEDTNKYADARIIFLDTEPSNWAYSATTHEYYWHRFYSTQPDLNYDNPRVQEEMLRVLKFWLDLGVDGFRLDAVPYLFEREGTNCENLPETHEFLKKVRKLVDEHYPGRLLLAEANQWPQDLLPYFGNGDELQMCFNFPLMPRLFMALAKQDKTPIIEVMNQMPSIPPGCQWATFLRNHDELTLEMVTPEEREFMWNYYAPEYSQRINLGIRRRLAPLLENDRARLELMHSLLFTLPGTPVLYYGDEIGMGDNVGLPDRNGVRTPMQWEDEVNAGFSAAPPDLLYSPVIRDPEYGFQNVNVAKQQADPNSLLHLVRKMNLIRKQLPMLAAARLEWLEEAPRSAPCFWRHGEDRRFLALHNLSDYPDTIVLPEGVTFEDALNPDEEIGEYVVLPPYGYRWLLEVVREPAKGKKRKEQSSDK
ncbi:MAG TPA: maltose alpha-D-glucosyltransferase [Oceanobacillus sp.]|nr:maltose alpha-D-glucosyltransferase [Oceanobacillus sp.]